MAAIQAATGATTAAGYTASEALGGALGAAAPLIAALVAWATTKDTIKDARAWAVIGKTATALQTAAWTSIDQANSFFAAIGGTTNKALLEQAVTLGANALFNQYASVQGPAGPITVNDFYKYTGQDPMPLQQQAQLLQRNIVAAVAKLQQLGVSQQELGGLAVNPEWGSLSMTGGRLPYSLPESLVRQLGAPLTGGSGDQYQAVAAMYGKNVSTEGVNAATGGPLWSMFLTLFGPTAPSQASYVDILAQQYGITAPALNGLLWASFGGDYVGQELGAIVAARYQDFTSGGP
jgi:phage FluMu protein gp41